MKSLALYIDKWYIVGAISTDGITRPVNLPNHEDRIWLYFYEDVANNEISYGKGFQSKFRNNEVHYYGDVFAKITSSSEKYIKFRLPQPMKSIFKDSGIFNDLRKDMEEENEITTYVSFSKDISLAARILFLNELRMDGFDVKESVARIGHLALEYASKKAEFEDVGYYLVMNACNENLYYSLYQRSDDLFLRECEECIFGLGTDVRSRALIEHVVDNINDKEHFLKTLEERESECLRMTQYVDEWLIKLSTARGFIPIQLTGITLSKDPFKEYSVSVKKVTIDERTKRMVTEIINVVVRFVKDNRISHDQIKGIILLGNTFTNSQFIAELSNHYNLAKGKMICYKDKDLPSLVGAYDFIDCSQFSVERDSMRVNAETELRRIKIAEEEAEANLKALEAEEQRAAEEQRRIDAERNFKDAMDKGYDAEKEHNYNEMAEYFGIALSHRPNDEEARQKHEEALRKKAEMAVQQNNYKEKIQQAKTAYDDKDYETAKFKAEEALGYMPESKEALRLKEESNRRIKSQKEFERYLDRADLFIAQKAYKEAGQELQKARLLDVDDKEIAERESKIANEQNAANAQVAEFSNNLNSALNEGRYDDALKFCNELIELDFSNSRRWSAKIAEINSKKERAAEEQKRWDKLLRDIDSAHLSEDWTKLNELCKEALAIRENSDIRSKFDKSESKLAEIRKNEQFVKSMSEINELAIKKEFDEANARLNNLERSLKKDGLLDSAKENQIRETRKSLFDFGQSSSDKSGSQGSNGNDTITIGIQRGKQPKPSPTTLPKKPSTAADFDWDFDTPQKNKQPDSRPAPKKTSSKPKGKITNDDFNF